MKYIDVKWKHNDFEFPIRLVSEIDDQSFEIRKLEFFIDGSVGHAIENESSKDTRLGDVEIPPIEEINSDKQFEAIEITEEIFNNLWNTYVAVGKSNS